MTPYDQEQITKNLMELTNTVHLGKLIPFLVSNEVYTNELIQSEIGIGSPSEQTKRMLLGLLKRGSQAFDNFILSLVQAEQFEAAHILRPDIKVPPPTPPPREEAGKDAIAGCVDIAVKKAVERYPGAQPNTCYRMESKPRGLAMIFVNEGKEDLHRLGAAKDKMLLKYIFNELGYKTLVFENTTKSEMTNILHNVTQETEHMTKDSFVIAVCSFGTENCIICHDSELISIEDITTVFDTDKCPLLDDKPKLYIIQTWSKDMGYATSDKSPSVDSSPHRCSADTIITQATMPDYLVSSKATGTSYISLITEVFMKRAWNTNLLTMLMEVNRRMNELREVGDEKPISATILRSWKKQFFFNPGL